MSEQTKAALEDAIRAHLLDEADEETRLLTDWYLITAAVGGEIAMTHYLHTCSSSPVHSLVGLTRIAQLRMEAEWGEM